MSHNPDPTKILIDSDVIRHFIYGGRLNDIVKIFPDRIIMVDVVRDELYRSTSLRLTIHNFIRQCNIKFYDEVLKMNKFLILIII